MTSERDVKLPEEIVAEALIEAAAAGNPDAARVVLDACMPRTPEQLELFPSAESDALERVAAAEATLKAVLERLDRIEATMRSYWPSFGSVNCAACGALVKPPHACPKCGKATA